MDRHRCIHGTFVPGVKEPVRCDLEWGHEPMEEHEAVVTYTSGKTEKVHWNDEEWREL